MALNPSFWQDRPTLVTGATGLVGGWVVRRLLELRADVVCIVRDWVPQSELVTAGMLERTQVVRGDILDQALLERVLGEVFAHELIEPTERQRVARTRADREVGG